MQSNFLLLSICQVFTWNIFWKIKANIRFYTIFISWSSFTLIISGLGFDEKLPISALTASPGKEFPVDKIIFWKKNMKCNIHIKIRTEKKHEKNYSFWNSNSTQQPPSVLCELRRPSSPITSRPTILEKNYRVRGRHQEGLEGSTSEFCTLAPPRRRRYTIHTLLLEV